MKYIQFYKLIIIIVSISTVNADSANGKTITGKVMHASDSTVQIEVASSENIQIEDKVTIYYKTLQGNEMKIGKLEVTKIDNNNSVSATPLDMDLPASAGMVAKITISSKQNKVQAIQQSHRNTHARSEDIIIPVKKSEAAIVRSQEYVDKAKKMMDDLDKNAKLYSEKKKNFLWNRVIQDIQKAVSMDNAEAYWLLALIHEDGYGDIKRDLGKMIDNIIKSAEKGYIEAQYMLGEMYANGDEVVRDKEEAKYWLQKAADKGHKDAKYKLDKLMHKKTKEHASEYDIVNDLYDLLDQ